MIIHIIDATNLFATDEGSSPIRLDEELVLHLFTQVLKSGHVLIVHLLQYKVTFVVLV